MLTYLIVLIVVGLIAGAVARLLVPGRDPIGLLGTIALHPDGTTTATSPHGRTLHSHSPPASAA